MVAAAMSTVEGLASFKPINSNRFQPINRPINSLTNPFFQTKILPECHHLVW